MKSREELELEAEKMFPIYPKMCGWKKGKAIWNRSEWVKEQMKLLNNHLK